MRARVLTVGERSHKYGKRDKPESTPFTKFCCAWNQSGKAVKMLQVSDFVAEAPELKIRHKPRSGVALALAVAHPPGQFCLWVALSSTLQLRFSHHCSHNPWNSCPGWGRHGGCPKGLHTSPGLLTSPQVTLWPPARYPRTPLPASALGSRL